MRWRSFECDTRRRDCWSSLRPATKLFVVTGPSGAGKGTLIKALIERRDDLEVAISATTRPQRPGEEDGRDYYFLTEEEFVAKVEAAEFLADLLEVRVGQVLDLLRVGHADGLADLLRGRAADAVDRGQADFGVLVGRNVDAGNACHGGPLSQP